MRLGRTRRAAEMADSAVTARREGVDVAGGDDAESVRFERVLDAVFIE